jgi:hypothetical protein
MAEGKPGETLVAFDSGHYKKVTGKWAGDSVWMHFKKPDGGMVHVNKDKVEYTESFGENPENQSVIPDDELAALRKFREQLRAEIDRTKMVTEQMKSSIRASNPIRVPKPVLKKRSHHAKR